MNIVADQLGEIAQNLEPSGYLSRKGSFKDCLEEDLSWMMTIRTTRRFSDMSYSRRDLLREYIWIRTQLDRKNNALNDRVEHFIEELSKSVAFEEIRKLAMGEEQVDIETRRMKDLVAKLRDVSCNPVDEPNQANFLDERYPDAIANRVVGAGEPVIPYLIDKIDNSEMTRCPIMTSGRSIDGEEFPYLLPVGYVAQVLLEAVGGDEMSQILQDSFAKHGNPLHNDPERSLKAKSEILELWERKKHERREKRVSRTANGK